MTEYILTSQQKAYLRYAFATYDVVFFCDSSHGSKHINNFYLSADILNFIGPKCDLFAEGYSGKEGKELVRQLRDKEITRVEFEYSYRNLGYEGDQQLKAITSLWGAALTKWHEGTGPRITHVDARDLEPYASLEPEHYERTGGGIIPDLEKAKYRWQLSADGETANIICNARRADSKLVVYYGLGHANDEASFVGYKDLASHLEDRGLSVCRVAMFDVPADVCLYLKPSSFLSAIGLGHIKPRPLDVVFYCNPHFSMNNIQGSVVFKNPAYAPPLWQDAHDIDRSVLSAERPSPLPLIRRSSLWL